MWTVMGHEKSVQSSEVSTSIKLMYWGEVQNVGYLHLILFYITFIAQHSTPLPVTGPQGQRGTACTCAPQPPQGQNGK